MEEDSDSQASSVYFEACAEPGTEPTDEATTSQPNQLAYSSGDELKASKDSASDDSAGPLKPEASEPENDSRADDEDGEFDNDIPDDYYYGEFDEIQEAGNAEFQPTPTGQQTVSNEAGSDGDTEQSTTSADSLQDKVARCDWSAVHFMLNSCKTAMTLADIKQALVKAIQTDNAPVICQLLPLLPESHVSVRGRAAMVDVQESLGNMFLPSFLSSAIRSGNLKAARALIRGPESSAGCKQLGETDLILAVQPGSHVDFVKEFLDTSCVNAQDLHGRTAVSYAAQYGLTKIVRFLVKEAGANPKIQDSQGWTPLEYAIAALDDEQVAEQMRADCSDIIDCLTTDEAGISQMATMGTDSREYRLEYPNRDTVVNLDDSI